MAVFVKRGKTYMARIPIKKDGKYNYKSKSGFRTKAEAQAWATEQETLINNGSISLLAKDQLLSDYFAEWVDIYKQDVATSTHVWHSRVEAYIKELLPEVTVKQLTRPMAQKFFNELGNRYSHETVSKVKAQLHQAIKNAIYDGLIAKDPIDGIKVTGKDGKNRELKFLEEPQMMALMGTIQDIEPEKRSASDMMILLGINTGARYEELAGLTWRDIHDSSISINKSWGEKDHQIQPTKTVSSNRTITVVPELIQDFYKWSPVNAHEPSDFVFGTKQPITSAAANKRLKALQIEIKSPKIITFHGLRHTHASWLLAHGVDIQYVSARLGHKNVGMTLKTYTHLLANLQNAEDEKSLKLLSEARLQH